MAATSIEWTDATWNPIRARSRTTGKVGHYCEMVSTGCANCYASKFQPRFGLPMYKGSEQRGSAFAESEVFLDEKVLYEPHRWKRPRRVFNCSMTDLFGAWVPDGWIMRCLDVWAQTPQHTHQILTKRPARMREFFTRWADLTGEDHTLKLVRGPEATRQAHPSPRGQLFAAMLETMGEPPPGCAYPTFDWMEGMIGWPSQLRNVWLGTSVENQQTADERIPELIATPASVRFLSVEPLLGPIDLMLDAWYHPDYDGTRPASELPGVKRVGEMIHWVIIGGESGPKARPCHIEWIRSLIRQCQTAQVACFVKQLGARPIDEEQRETPVRLGDELRLRDSKGGDWEEWDKDLRIREFPR